MKKFIHELGAAVTLISGEKGTVVARAEYLEAEPSYLVRYPSAQGVLTERWWAPAAILESHGAAFVEAGA